MNDGPENLSEIDPEVDGNTADEVIKGRQIRDQWIKAAAKRGNKIALQSENLDLLARHYGYNWIYDEELDEDDVI